MPNHYLIFTIEEQSYGIRLFAVEKVIRAAELISLPEGPDALLGLINLSGKSVPVVNIRRYFQLPDREMELSDKIVICRTETYTAAFIADNVEGVVLLSPDDMDRADQIFPEMEYYIEGVGRINSRTVVICDIHRLFSANEKLQS